MADIRKSSGNVFKDLGVPNSAEALAKAELARKIMQVVEERDLTQTEAAEILGVDQSKVSALSRGRLGGFSTDRLFRFLNALDQDVEIVIKKKPRSRANARVRVVNN